MCGTKPAAAFAEKPFAVFLSVGCTQKLVCFTSFRVFGKIDQLMARMQCVKVLFSSVVCNFDTLKNVVWFLLNTSGWCV